MDFPFTETFPPRKEPDTLNPEAENDLFDFYVEKSKRPHDWFYQQANMISGSADYLPSDAGMPLE